jgi:hypothetical protein
MARPQCDTHLVVFVSQPLIGCEVLCIVLCHDLLIGCQDLGIVLCHDLRWGVKTFDDAASLTPTVNLDFQLQMFLVVLVRSCFALCAI